MKPQEFPEEKPCAGLALNTWLGVALLSLKKA
jgi:hypothetical protein